MLPKLLLTSAPEGRIEVRHDTRIGLIEQEAQGMTLRDTTGSVVIQADAVIVTAPAPQAADILEASLLHDPLAPRVDALRAVPYKSCLTVILHYAAPTPEPPAYALLAANRERPLLWLAFESVKAAERAPDGGTLLIAQLGPQISRDHYRSPDEEVFALTIKELRALFGADYATPDWWQVKRWLYSQPQGQADFDVVNPPGTRVLVCGDALRPGNGRIHEAFASGLEAATRLTAAASSEY